SSAQSIFPEASEGRQVALTTVAALRPTPALRVEARWVHQRLTRARDGSRFSTANIPRLKLEYQLTRAIFVRYIGQYFAEDQAALRSEEHTSELQSRFDLVCRLLLEKKNNSTKTMSRRSGL